MFVATSAAQAVGLGFDRLLSVALGLLDLFAFGAKLKQFAVSECLWTLHASSGGGHPRLPPTRALQMWPFGRDMACTNSGYIFGAPPIRAKEAIRQCGFVHGSTSCGFDWSSPCECFEYFINLKSKTISASNVAVIKLLRRRWQFFLMRLLDLWFCCLAHSDSEQPDDWKRVKWQASKGSLSFCTFCSGEMNS